MAATGVDPITACDSATTMNLVGPGLGEVGATDDYTVIPEPGLGPRGLMLTGRLEVFTVLALFTPAFWRPNVA